MCKKILIGSPVRQKPEILKHFLQSLACLQQKQFEASYLFIDNNDDEQSKELLKVFKEQQANVILIEELSIATYQTNDTTHYWNEQLIWRVAAMKNTILQYALEHQFDFVFLIDSDLLIQPETIEHLMTANKDIISEIFWTRWTPEAHEQPQVWLKDEYVQYEKHRGEDLSGDEIGKRYNAFLTKLRTQGIFEVGGLGACTLISGKALEAGVNFNEISNLSFWGEDRHFCIRANALGIPLYVDTHFPAYHIYRNEDLQGVDAFLQSHATKPKCYKLTLSMIVKNERHRYLEQALKRHRAYIDEAVIIDDGSTDGSAELCEEILQGIPLTIIRNSQSKFSNEIELRKQQWDETLNTKPDWILNLDADEWFESGFKEKIPQMLSRQDIDGYCFRLYDLWDDQHYREDTYWQSHHVYRPFLFRYREDFQYEWNEVPQHCGRFPNNIFSLPHEINALRIKHLGWAKVNDRIEKYERYKLLDPQNLYGNSFQYETILDDNPTLILWDD